MKLVVNKYDVTPSQVSIHNLTDTKILVGKHNCPRNFCVLMLKCLGYQKYQWFELLGNNVSYGPVYKSVKGAVEGEMINNNHLPKIYTIESHEDLIKYLTQKGEIGLTENDLKVGMYVKLARTPDYYTCFSVGDIVRVYSIDTTSITAEKDGKYQTLKIQDLELVPELQPGDKVKASNSRRFYSWQTLTYIGRTLSGKAVVQDSEYRSEEVDFTDLKLAS
jgi:hypothetical protein